ncbi:MAG TPA: UDP-3-O-acyl-N-acetylglucosamine deacetylase [Polyangia bacterium]|nr:UDP-3-O-acyl-N-acetylglucosamine deacetylase [Polyangia bacterium]
MLRPFFAEGIGLHTGEPARVAVEPVPPGPGLVFETGAGPIPGSPDAIAGDAERRTDLAAGLARVRTVEHLLAALWWFGLTDARIRVDGPEIPALDGGAAGWCALLEKAGAVPAPRLVPLAAPLDVSGEPGSRALLVPVDSPESVSVRVELRYGDPAIGEQEFSFAPGRDDFTKAVAPARTFALLGEVEALLARGLARGGGLHNALVIGPEGPVNPEGARFEGEPARHKLLDALGDLSLLGGLPRARIDLIRPGHRLLHAVVRAATKLAPGPGNPASRVPGC